MVSIAVMARVSVVMSACCVVGMLARRVHALGLEGLWAGHPSALPATVTVAVTGAGAAVGSVAAIRMVRGTVAFRRQTRAAAVEVPDFARAAAERAGLADRVTVVEDGRPFALTHGMLRPSVLVSMGLLSLLDPAELGAVLAHEREHVRSRDPLQTAMVRVLVGRLFFLPVIGELAERFALGREMAADRRAVSECGRRAVAGALLRVVEHPRWAAGAPAAAMGSARMLDARICQLEGGRPPSCRLGRARLASSVVAVALLLWAAAGSAALAAHDHGDRCHGTAATRAFSRGESEVVGTPLASAT
jgi:beta-lactamase regulating signal transducer with metallopeptidase domain